MRNRTEKGITLLVGAVSLIFIVPLMGLVVDVGFLYATKSKLQASVDGAALAAARGLSIGVGLSAQTVSAKNSAVNWFYSNFPNGRFGTTGTVMSASNVTVAADANNAQLLDVTVSATTQVDTFFMKFLGFGVTTVGATGTASRRTVVAMLVLDRSGSMGVSCPDLINAAKLFTGQFAEGTDYIGAISFSDGSYLHSAPTQSFQSTLGYINSSGSGTGELDSIVCSGGTATPFAVSYAYNQLYQTNLPGALNILMIETDGLPNSLTENFWDASSSGIKSTSACVDKNGKTMANGGFNNAAAIPSWTTGLSFGAGSYFTNIPAGIVGDIYSDDPGGANDFVVMNGYYMPHQTGTPNFTPPKITGSAANYCNFQSNPNAAYNYINDIGWVPTTDVFGNKLAPSSGAYQTGVTMTGSHVVANSWSAFHAAVLNATDNAAYNARNNYGQASSVGIGPVTVFTIALGGNTGDQPDPILLQRMANDPNGDTFNSPPMFNACSSEPTCITYSSQPQGLLIYSSNRYQLSQAFQTISSQILRLSK
jgi:Flp pilus assembly protein TadG